MTATPTEPERTANPAVVVDPAVDTGQAVDVDPDVTAFRDDVAALYRRLRSKRADHKLTPTQLQALGHLHREGPMTARELARFEQVTPQSIARTLAILESDGMVARVPDPADARASVVSLTAHGRRTLAEDRARRSQWLADLLSRDCTDAERQLLFDAGRIMRRLAAEPGRPA